MHKKTSPTENSFKARIYPTNCSLEDPRSPPTSTTVKLPLNSCRLTATTTRCRKMGKIFPWSACLEWRRRGIRFVLMCTTLLPTFTHMWSNRMRLVSRRSRILRINWTGIWGEMCLGRERVLRRRQLCRLILWTKSPSCTIKPRWANSSKSTAVTPNTSTNYARCSSVA